MFIYLLQEELDARILLLLPTNRKQVKEFPKSQKYFQGENPNLVNKSSRLQLESGLRDSEAGT